MFGVVQLTYSNCAMCGFRFICLPSPATGSEMVKEYQERILEFPADLEQLGADMARSLSSDGND